MCCGDRLRPPPEADIAPYRNACVKEYYTGFLNLGASLRRRDFILGLGGAAAMPLAARAQQAERVRRIGVLMNLVADDVDAQANIAAFLQVLQQLGWAEGRNVRIDTRWPAGDASEVRRHA